VLYSHEAPGPRSTLAELHPAGTAKRRFATIRWPVTDREHTSPIILEPGGELTAYGFIAVKLGCARRMGTMDTGDLSQFCRSSLPLAPDVQSAGGYLIGIAVEFGPTRLSSPEIRLFAITGFLVASRLSLLCRGSDSVIA
jgi:hypothetical protein